MKYQFYKVTEGVLPAKFAEIAKEREVANAARVALRDALGATNVLTYTAGGVAAFTFDQDPDLSVWKTTAHGWMPKVSTKDGKKIGKMIQDCGRCPDFQEALKVLGKLPRMVLGESRARGVAMYNTVLQGGLDDGVFFVKAPVTESEPFDKPHETMIPIKEWEFHKYVEENGGD